MKQSQLMSLIEAVANVIVGYGLAVVTQIIVFPWFGLEAGLIDHFTIGFVFVGVSLCRSYLLRRLFETLYSKKGASAKLAQSEAEEAARSTASCS